MDGTDTLEPGLGEDVEAGAAKLPPGTRLLEDLAQAGEKDEVPASDITDATAYLLSAYHEEVELAAEQDLVVNVGTPQEPKLIAWKIKALPGDRLRHLRARAASAVAQNRKGITAAMIADSDASFEADVRVVLEGTLDPDLKALAQTIGVADPAEVLKDSLRFKQGLISRISGAIVDLSGWQDEAVQDAREVNAVGNS